jgi:hypothetical protein
MRRPERTGPAVSVSGDSMNSGRPAVSTAPFRTGSKRLSSAQPFGSLPAVTSVDSAELRSDHTAVNAGVVPVNSTVLAVWST